MMAAGAVVVAFGIAVVSLSNSCAVSALGMFVAGVGGSAVASLVFYAVAVKGATRFRGTLIGALGMVFTMRLGSGNVDNWTFDLPMLVLAVSSVLAPGRRSSPLRTVAESICGYLSARQKPLGDIVCTDHPPRCRLVGVNSSPQ